MILIKTFESFQISEYQQYFSLHYKQDHIHGF